MPAPMPACVRRSASICRRPEPPHRNLTCAGPPVGGGMSLAFSSSHSEPPATEGGHSMMGDDVMTDTLETVRDKEHTEIVSTGNGPVRGYRDGGLAIFKGLRYGAAPLGALR